MSWQNALVDYAKTRSPATLPSEILLLSTDHTISIYDRFPKAMFHFLTLPRLPFIEPASSAEIPQASLNSLAALLANRHALAVLKLLKEASLEVIEQIQDEMLKKEGFVWPISVGFHAIESMAHVHLHIISRDFISPSLKNKKHWNSFNPKHGFFLHLDDMVDWVEKRTVKEHNKSKRAYEDLLKADMICHQCGKTVSNIPQLKLHLNDHFTHLKSSRLEAEDHQPNRKRQVHNTETCSNARSIGDSVAVETLSQYKRLRTDERKGEDLGAPIKLI